MFGKKLRNNGQKVFYIHTNIVTKKRGEKTSETIFQKVTISAFKNVGKKLSEKSAKKRILYSHKYHYQKMRGKNARYNFSRNTRIVRAKNGGKKIVGKKGEKKFFIFTQIS